MLEKGGGYEAVPQLESLLRILQSVQQMLAPYAASPQPAAQEPDLPTAGASPVQSAPQVGMIASRDDVHRALDAVMGYYRNSEPGSLVPLIVERAKRLVSLNFLDALAEVAPEVVDPVKRAVGVRE
jgi:type VI secretion system protein ImpA